MSTEIDSWGLTVTVMLMVSIFVGLVQRTYLLFIDPIFEIFVFHIPTILAIIIYSKINKNNQKST